MTSRVIALVSAALVIGSPQVLRAQGEATIDANTRWSANGPSAFVRMRSADVLEHKQAYLGALFDFQHRPAMLTREGERYAAVRNSLGFELALGMGLFDQVQFGFVLPVSIVQGGVGVGPLMGDFEADETKLFLFRDMRVSLEWRPSIGRVLAAESEGFSVLTGLTLSVPTGDEEQFAGETGWVLAPQIVGDYRVGAILLAIDIAGKIRTRTTEIGASRFASALAISAGGAYLTMNDRISVAIEASTQLQLATQSELATRKQHTFEVGASGSFRPKGFLFAIRLGVSSGVGGLGAPSLRIILGVTSVGASSRVPPVGD